MHCFNVVCHPELLSCKTGDYTNMKYKYLNIKYYNYASLIQSHISQLTLTKCKSGMFIALTQHIGQVCHRAA